MNRNRAISLAVALCCLFAIGASATTLESTVETKPGDVFSADDSPVPLGSQDASDLKRQFQSQGGDTGATVPQTRPGNGDQEQQSSSNAGENTDPGGSSNEPGGANAIADGDGDEGMGPGDDSPSLLDRLLDLLRSLLPLALLLTGVVVGIQYRDRLLARLRERLGRSDATANHQPTPRLEPKPTNEVERAWVEMARRLALDDDPTVTPGECARAAREADIDPDVIRTLTRVFEEVQYGEAEVTPERERRAREGIERFRAQYRTGGTR